MKYSRLLLFGMILNLSPILVSTSLAQGQTAQNAAPSTPACPIIKNLQFPGGTVGDYVKALQEVCPTANIMVASPEALQIKLPPIKLQSVAFKGAVELVEGKYQVSETLFAHISIDSVGELSDNSAAPIYRITMHHSGMPSANSVRVWNIGELLGVDQKAEDVLTAVETAVGLLSIQEKAQIRYHAATTLLVASGKDLQLQAIDRVVEGLQEGLKQAQRKRAESDHRELAALVASMKESGRPDDKQTLLLIEGMMQELSRRQSGIEALQQMLHDSSRK